MMRRMEPPLNVALDRLEDRGELDDSDALFDTFEAWAVESGRPLYDHQSESVLELLAGDHVILQTPTGSGKSMVGLAAHFISLARGGRSYYAAPLKALVSEKFFELVELFGADNVGLVTGDASLNAQAPIICCTAEILANQSLREGPALDADTVVLDEFHFYADPQRGWAWQVPLMELHNAQFVLMSATLGNTANIAADLERSTGRPVAVVAQDNRPVPLEFTYAVDPLPVVLERLLKDGLSPIYLVSFTQAQAVKTAVDVAQTVPLPKVQQDALKSVLATEKLDRGFGKRLRQLLSKGVGVHHAGMLPRYRRLVERLAQAGLLSIISGTDTLGVGINVPIRTVVFTSLAKFDGRRSRLLRAREFHQIAGRAGRAGFDTQGLVVGLGSEREIEQAAHKARLTKAEEDRDTARLRKLKKRKNAPKKASPAKSEAGQIAWNRATFDRLVGSEPETLVPAFQTSHSMFLNVLAGPRDTEPHLIDLAEQAHASLAKATGQASTETSGQQSQDRNMFLRQFGQIFSSLRRAEVIERGRQGLVAARELPDEFALNQPLAPFALAALDLLDPDSPDYDLDVLSVIEAVLENPMPVLLAQRKAARDAAFAALREEGASFEERTAQLDEVGWPAPLEEILEPAFATYRRSNPWTGNLEVAPKKILRQMVEEGLTFTDFIARYDLTASEGAVLRYLSDAYRALRQILPEDARTNRILEITNWLRDLLESVDASLVQEWESMGTKANSQSGPGQPTPDTSTAGTEELAFGASPDGTLSFTANPHAMRAAIRKAVFARVEQAAYDRFAALATREQEAFPTGAQLGQVEDFSDPKVWEDALGAYWDDHEQIGLGPQATSGNLYFLNETPDEADLLLATGLDRAEDLPLTGSGDLNWMIVDQHLMDGSEDSDWSLTLLVDVAATQEASQPRLITAQFSAR